MTGTPSEPQSRLHIPPDLLDMSQRSQLFAEIRVARPTLTEGALRQEVFLLCYGDEFSPEERQKIQAAIAAYWARRATEHQPEPASKSRGDDGG